MWIYNWDPANARSFISNRKCTHVFSHFFLCRKVIFVYSFPSKKHVAFFGRVFPFQPQNQCKRHACHLAMWFDKPHMFKEAVVFFALYCLWLILNMWIAQAHVKMLIGFFLKKINKINVVEQKKKQRSWMQKNSSICSTLSFSDYFAIKEERRKKPIELRWTKITENVNGKNKEFHRWVSKKNPNRMVYVPLENL